MTLLHAQDIYDVAGPNALRAAVRGAVLAATRDGWLDRLVFDVGVPVVQVAESLRLRGLKAEANGVLEHAVHDGLNASVLSEAVAVATDEQVRADTTPSDINVDLGTTSALFAGPPPEATDLASAIELVNFMRARLLVL